MSKETFAFASCSKVQHYKGNNYDGWSEILNIHPDFLLLLGDNIYLDKNNGYNSPSELKDNLIKNYSDQLNEPKFRAVIDDIKTRNGRVAAIWDDHDFLGNNRCGRSEPKSLKDVTTEIFLSNMTFGFPRKVIYHVFDTQLARVIMLDTRTWRREAGEDNNDPYAMLGEEQSKWFEQQLTHQFNYTLISSGSTLHPYSHGDESWTDYPEARKWIIDRIKNKNGVLFLSGDIHHNAWSSKNNVIELVSSGVARKATGGLVGKRANWGQIDLYEDHVEIDLHSRDKQERLQTKISLDDWFLEK